MEEKEEKKGVARTIGEANGKKRKRAFSPSTQTRELRFRPWGKWVVKKGGVWSKRNENSLMREG